MVQAQLLLIPTDSAWRLDPSTRRIGRQGLALARAALAAATAGPDLCGPAVVDSPTAPVEQPLAA